MEEEYEKCCDKIKEKKGELENLRKLKLQRYTTNLQQNGSTKEKGNKILPYLEINRNFTNKIIPKIKKQIVDQAEILQEVEKTLIFSKY